jgi:hypothetical protein
MFQVILHSGECRYLARHSRSVLMLNVLRKAFKGELLKDLTGFQNALMKPVRSNEKVNAQQAALTIGSSWS